MRRTTRYSALRTSLEFEKYHPHYFVAIYVAPSAATRNSDVSFESWEIPKIEFETEDWTRRSMVLNGMRMGTEYFAHGSPRVLTLVDQRLQSGQSDVIHDLLVYLWERVLQVRAEMGEARALQAESLAAYLGVPSQPVIELFLASELSAGKIEHQILEGNVGTPRRTLDIAPLVENLLARLQPELEQFQAQENQILQLIDDIVSRLYDHSN